MQLKHSISLPGFLWANFRTINKFLLAQNNQGKKSLHLLPDFLVFLFLPRKQSVIDGKNLHCPYREERQSMHVYKHLGYSAVIWPEATYFAFLSHPIQFLSATHSSSQSSALFCIKEPTSGIKMKPSLKYCTTPPSFLSHPPSSLSSVRLLLSKPPSSPH